MNMAKERFIRSGAFAMSAKTIAEANLYDDELFLFSCYGNTAMTELILGIILGQPVKVRSFTPQKTLTNAKLSDKSVRFDVEVELADRTMCDIEVQNTLDAGFRQRTRYNAASLDTHMLRKGQHYTEPRRSIVVAITPSDPFHKGLPVYRVSRTVQETGKEYGDGSGIVYLNGQWDGDDAVGDLAHDLRCTRPEEMRYDVLREAVKPYKDLGGGQMIKTAREIFTEQGIAQGRMAGIAEGKTEMLRKIGEAKRLLAERMSVSEVMQKTGLSENEVALLL